MTVESYCGQRRCIYTIAFESISEHAARHYKAQHSMQLHGTALVMQHDVLAHHIMQLRGSAQHSIQHQGTAQHSTAQHSMQTHGTAKHSTSWHSTTSSKLTALPGCEA